jgi:hypothetical protein
MDAVHLFDNRHPEIVFPERLAMQNDLPHNAARSSSSMMVNSPSNG